MGEFVFVGGVFSSIGGERCANIAQIDPNTGAAIPNPMMWTNGEVRTIALAGETLYVGGWFSNAVNRGRNGMAAFDLRSGMITGWDPQASPDARVRQVIVSNGVVYASGEFSSIRGHQRNHLAALHPETGEPTSWNPRANSYARILGVRDSTVYVSGTFTEIGGETRSVLAALHTETAAATPWDPHAVGSTWASFLADDFLYVAGPYSQVGGRSNVRIAQLDYATGTATDWSPDLFPGDAYSIYSLAILDSTLYVGGRGYVRAVYIPSALTTEWHLSPDRDVPVLAIAPHASTVYAGGGYFVYHEHYINYFAAAPADTSRNLPNPPPPTSQDTDLSLVISPNPASIRAEIYFFIPADGEVELGIFDIAGRKVGSLVRGPTVGGAHHETFHARHLATGVYLVRLEYNGKANTKKFVLLQ
jgi:hypothetical protein